VQDITIRLQDSDLIPTSRSIIPRTEPELPLCDTGSRTAAGYEGKMQVTRVLGGARKSS
jgi:hypothetical protein